MTIVDSIREVNHIFRRYRDINLLSGDNYNIFRVIGLTNNEVRVHSAFLANLLDVRGDHGLGTSFLTLFLSQLNIKNFDIPSAQVKAERSIGVVTETTGGRVDIDIWDKNGTHIIIENKIDADDQPNQMVRYHSYGKNQCKLFYLFYLTLDGSTPDVIKSCTNVNTNYVLKEEEDYKCLSYSSDIFLWLGLCKEKAVNKPLIREGISHYINLIKYLTNDTMSDAMKKEVSAELLKKNNVESLYLLKESISTVEEELQLQFWRKLKERIIDAGYTLTRDNSEEGVKSFYKTSRLNRYYGFEIDVDSASNLFYGIRMDNYLYAGFTIREGESNDQNLSEKYSILRDRIKEFDSVFQANPYWVGWKWIGGSFSFTNINECYCKEMANMDDFVKRIVEGVTVDINNFRNSYKNK